MSESEVAEFEKIRFVPEKEDTRCILAEKLITGHRDIQFHVKSFVRVKKPGHYQHPVLKGTLTWKTSAGIPLQVHVHLLLDDEHIERLSKATGWAPLSYKIIECR